MKIPPFPNELCLKWDEAAIKATKLAPAHSFIDREYTLRRDWYDLHERMPEYLNESFTWLDISCGSGATLEILKYLKVKAMGIEAPPLGFGAPTRNNCYAPLLDSIPVDYVLHDCRKVPYPIPDLSYDVVRNYRSIAIYDTYDKWHLFLDEFARIARKCICLYLNCVMDEKLSENEYGAVMDWVKQSDFKIVQTLPVAGYSKNAYFLFKMVRKENEHP